MVASDISPDDHRIRARGKVLAGGLLGNIVEYYDFSLYGTLAVFIATQFFPNNNATTELMATYAGVVLAYALRPVAAVALGPLVDLKGRKFVLMLTIVCMSVGTVGIGVMPTYAAIGIAAPILLLCCRVLQAVGASVEYTTAANFIFESDRGNRRNFLAGLSVASTSIGPLLATLAALITIESMTDASFSAWGWRIPFLVALPLALFTLWIRKHVDETEDLKQLKARAEQSQVKQTPFREAVRDHWLSMLRAIGLGAGQRVGSFVIQAYFVTAMINAGFAASNALLASLLTYIIGPLPAIVGGRIADRYGARVPVIIGYGLFVICTVPTFTALGGTDLGLAITAVVVFTVINNFVGAPLTTAYVMSFPPEVRGSASALNYNVGTTLLGSTAGLIASWLHGLTGSDVTFGWYMTVICVISIAVAIFAMPRAVDEQRRLAKAAS